MSGKIRNHDGRKSQKWEDNFDSISALYYNFTAPQVLQILLDEYGFDTTYVSKIQPSLQ